ncbi:MAG: DUF5915 domain-containing protein, partial [bacterium]|nr:DUF5915 domain-containing protein [bacterium]
LKTLHTILVGFSKAAAPIIPFITETIYRNLTSSESVHLTDYPEVENITVKEAKLLEDMKLTRQIASLAQSARLEAKIPIKQPLANLQIQLENQLTIDDTFLEIIAQELNIKSVILVDTIDNSFTIVEEKEIQIGIDTALTEELQVEGKLREILRSLQEARKNQGFQVSDSVVINWYSDTDILNKVFQTYSDQIKQTVKAREIIKAKSNDNLTKLDKDDLYLLIEK